MDAKGEKVFRVSNLFSGELCWSSFQGAARLLSVMAGGDKTTADEAVHAWMQG